MSPGSVARTALVAALATMVAGVAFATGPASGTHELDMVVEEIALVAVSGNVAASFTASGYGLAATESDPAFLRYTLVVRPGQTRSIAVHTDAQLPPGLSLHVSVGAPTGGGRVGSPMPGGATFDNAYLPGTELTLLTGIGTCWTGTASTDGAPLLLSLEVDDAAGSGLKAGDTLPDVTLYFTIID